MIKDKLELHLSSLKDFISTVDLKSQDELNFVLISHIVISSSFWYDYELEL